MKTEETATIEVSTDMLKLGLIAIETLADGLHTNAYTSSVEKILQDERKARDFIIGFYDLTAGALLSIQTISNIINTAITNNDLQLIPGTTQEEMLERYKYRFKVKAYEEEKANLLKDGESLSASELSVKLQQLAKKYNI